MPGASLRIFGTGCVTYERCSFVSRFPYWDAVGTCALLGSLTSKRSPIVLECAYVPSLFRFLVVEVKQLCVDSFMTTALFYLMLSPLPGRYSFDHWVAKPKPNNPKSLAFWPRVLQVHLCLIYFSSGLAKFLGDGWWDGSNLSRSLIRPAI